MDTNKTPPVILTIAGSDSGGGAGIQADLKTMTVLGGFGVSVIAALTAQNGAEVRGVADVDPAFVVQQYETVFEGFPIRAAKLGMLSSSQVINALAPRLATKNFPLVVDPVCVSQSGFQLLQADAVDSLRERIIPLADLLTPNVPEAEFLSGCRILSSQDVQEPIDKLLSMGAKAVLLKGGHMDEYLGQPVMIDWLGLPGQAAIPLPHPYVETTNNHGTGCTLSAAIATYLAFGLDLTEAVKKAQDFLIRALGSAFAPGIGAGPPNFLAGAGYSF